MEILLESLTKLKYFSLFSYLLMGSLFIILCTIAALFIKVLRMRWKSIKFGKFGELDAIKKSVTESGDGVYMDIKTFKRIVFICEEAYNVYYSKKENLDWETDNSIKENQERCLQSAIDLMISGYHSEEETHKEWLILRLYLEHDFSFYATNILKRIYENKVTQSWDDNEVSINITLEVDDFILRMKNKIKEEYIFIDNDTLMALYDMKKEEIKNKLIHNVREFISLTKNKQKEIIKIQEECHSSIERQIRDIIEVEEDKKEEISEEKN